MVHRKWLEREASMTYRTSSERIAYLDFVSGQRRLRLTTVHLPHSGHSHDEYDAALAALEEVIADGRRRQLTNIVGIDGNAVIGTKLHTDCDDIVGNFGIGRRSCRGDALVSWMHGRRLAALNTMRDKGFEGAWTHESWSTREKKTN